VSSPSLTSGTLYRSSRLQELSLAVTLKVGVAIEDIYILAPQSHLIQVDNADILQVFDNLLNGSEPPLSVFVSMLSTQTCRKDQLHYLSAEAYQAIIADASVGYKADRGAGGGGQGGRGGFRGSRP